PRSPQGHRGSPQVRREAPGPRHPPRPRGLRARAVRSPGGRAVIERRRVRQMAALGLVVVLGLAGSMSIAPAAAQQATPAQQVVLRAVDATADDAVTAVVSYGGP